MLRECSQLLRGISIVLSVIVVNSLIKNTPIKTWCLEQIKSKQSNQVGDKLIQTKINRKR